MHAFWAYRYIKDTDDGHSPFSQELHHARTCNPETNFTFPGNSDSRDCLNPTGQAHSPRPDFRTPQLSFQVSKWLSQSKGMPQTNKVPRLLHI